MTTENSLPSADTSAFAETQPFVYRGCHFLCGVIDVRDGLYQAHVLYQHGLHGIESIALPFDSEPYGSAPEALRHAQQQAVRWVHDRTGDGQGRF